MNNKKLNEVMKWLPENTEEYIPDLVHDFLLENWEKVKEAMESE